MCHIIRNIYTVCAHCRVGELVECEQQKARIEQWRSGGWCVSWYANLQFTLRSCRPVEQTKLKYRFCDECRGYYKDYDTKSANSILNYWAFKNARYYIYSVAPHSVPGDLVFDSTVPAQEDPRVPRLELYALDYVWPRKPFEKKASWLQRLDKARTLTLELAAEGWDRASVARSEAIVCIQPRALSPMAVDPYAGGLSPITERSDSRTTTTRSISSQVKKRSRQDHPETLRKLCGEGPSALFAPKPRTAGPKQGGTATGSRLASPFDHEAPSPPGITPPPTRCLTAPKTQQRSNNPQRTISRSESVARESVSSPFGKASSAIAASGELNGKAFNDVSLSEAASQAEEEDGPNMTSHFSVSSIDPDDAAELASVRTVSPPSENSVSDGAISVTAADSAIDIASPTPVRHPSPPRFTRENAVLSTAEESGTNDSSERSGQ